MIELERHIEILLLNNDCVIVPDLGGFMAHHVDASYDEEEEQFLPPLRTLGFNPQLTMNDSLLVQSYIEAYDLSYPEALRRIESEVVELKQHLENEGCYDLNDIGMLRLNSEGHYEFEPCEAGILTPALYGLSSLSMPLLEEKRKHKQATVVPIEEMPADDSPIEAEPADVEEEIIDVEEQEAKERSINIKLSWIRNAAAVAAAIICFFFITSPISNSQMAGEVQQSSVFHISSVKAKPAIAQGKAVESSVKEQIAEEDSTAEIQAQPSDSIVEAPKQEEPAKVATEEIAEDCYVIVLASQISKKNAIAFVEKLHNEGFKEARTYINNNMVRVVYGSYATDGEAQDSLKTLRLNRNFREGWVYRLRN